VRAPAHDGRDAFVPSVPEVLVRVVEAFHRMLAVYGLYMNESGLARARKFSARRGNWVTPANYNFLRVTRMLKSLCLLGLPQYAAAFFDFLVRILAEERKVIGVVTFAFWKRAVP